METFQHGNINCHSNLEANQERLATQKEGMERKEKDSQEVKEGSKEEKEDRKEKSLMSQSLLELLINVVLTKTFPFMHTVLASSTPLFPFYTIHNYIFPAGMCSPIYYTV